MVRNSEMCCVPNCGKTRSDSVTLHKFPSPVTEPDRFRSWIYSIGGDVLSLDKQFIQQNRKVCHIHFEQKYILYTRGNRLSNVAVPTLYLKGSDSVTLHKFPSPVTEPDRFRSWIYSVGGDVLSLDNQLIHQYRKVCHIHFEQKYVTRGSRLSNVAVPTLYLEGGPMQSASLQVASDSQQASQDAPSVPLSQNKNQENTSQPKTSVTAAGVKMDELHSCRCCLRGAPDKDLTTPYTHLGKTEIYSDMLKDCFDIQMSLDDADCGICWVCVDRLRDATDFKQQVQRCQGELLALKGEGHVKDVRTVIKTEYDVTMEDVNVLEVSYDRDKEKLEPEEEDDTVGEDDTENKDDTNEESVVKSEQPDGDVEMADDEDSQTGADADADDPVSEAGADDAANDEDFLPDSDHEESDVEGAGSDEDVGGAGDEDVEGAGSDENVGGAGDEDSSGPVALMGEASTEAESSRPLLARCTVRLERLRSDDMSNNTTAARVKEHSTLNGQTPLNQTDNFRVVYSCVICVKKFSCKTLYDIHIQTHIEKEYICDICKKKFNMKSVLIRHMYAKHMDHVCKICKKKFKEKRSLNEHIVVHTGEKCFKCEICLKKFALSRYLRDHKRIHTGERPYKCQECNKQFKDRTTLRRHKKIHTGDKAHSCDICNKSFICNSFLKIHKRIHTGEKLYKCDQCDQVFSHSSGLYKHKREIHTRGNIYICEVCGEKFPQKILLGQHKKCHNGQKAYACEECGKRFDRKDQLDFHKITHTEDKKFICEVCSKPFKRKTNLDQHKKIHAEKSYRCSYCDKQFTHKHQLEAHERTHTGEKAHICDQCGKQFSQNYMLLKHKKVHSAEIPDSEETSS